jgi:hypothetical protein
MKNKLPISVILPIKSAIVKDFEEYFDKAIKSITSNDVIPSELVIVHTQEEKLISFLESYNFEDLNVKKLKFEETPNYSSQINFGIKNSEYEWISIFEFDDEYSSIWFRNVKKYMDLIAQLDLRK